VIFIRQLTIDGLLAAIPCMSAQAASHPGAFRQSAQPEGDQQCHETSDPERAEGEPPYQAVRGATPRAQVIQYEAEHRRTDDARAEAQDRPDGIGRAQIAGWD